MSVLTNHFVERLDGKISEPTLSYVIQVMSSYGLSTENDLSKNSLVLAFLDAKTRFDFASFQRIGDWSLWALSILPKRENNDVIYDVGSMSYRMCHTIVKKWDVYKHLSTNMHEITKTVNDSLFR